MASTFEMPHIVEYDECDMTQQISIPMIFSVMMIVSNAQSEALNVGDAYVHSLGLGWIILEYQVDIIRRPRENEEITLSTTAREFNNYFAKRDFNMIDADGNAIVQAHALFALMDMNKRKITKIPQDMVACYEPTLVKRIKRGVDAIPELTADQITHAADFTVRYTDIDFNQHVNNSRYFDWMINALDFDFLNQHEVKHIAIRFDKEVGQKDTITSQAAVDPVAQQTVHEIRFADGHLSAQAVLDWTTNAN
ncbi:medium-chain acyl-[acyl-carrier-protein] hydrolase [Weissella uvarum]|uniref:acyl-[acyl-carrier-protein] thioesterase n=1 Tax=Weissella uvarum TaxID=1479233 RepID=UPI001960D397|nr:acyl-ACP thioesterase domain-containing protein [Weissella uvarum]MBM7616790.1 medium-chain acyl-[acyl-carrier-protein] hydrolase [Weissella uvarum]MCM0594756.1 acyl-ACP thioesterase [Weissella uvarum]